MPLSPPSEPHIVLKKAEENFTVHDRAELQDKTSVFTLLLYSQAESWFVALIRRWPKHFDEIQGREFQVTHLTTYSCPKANPPEVRTWLFGEQNWVGNDGSVPINPHPVRNTKWKIATQLCGRRSHPNTRTISEPSTNITDPFQFLPTNQQILASKRERSRRRIRRERGEK